MSGEKPQIAPNPAPQQEGANLPIFHSGGATTTTSTKTKIAPQPGQKSESLIIPEDGLHKSPMATTTTTALSADLKNPGIPIRRHHHRRKEQRSQSKEPREWILEFHDRSDGFNDDEEAGSSEGSFSASSSSKSSSSTGGGKKRPLVFIHSATTAKKRQGSKKDDDDLLSIPSGSSSSSSVSNNEEDIQESENNKKKPQKEKKNKKRSKVLDPVQLLLLKRKIRGEGWDSDDEEGFRRGLYAFLVPSKCLIGLVEEEEQGEAQMSTAMFEDSMGRTSVNEHMMLTPVPDEDGNRAEYIVLKLQASSHPGGLSAPQIQEEVKSSFNVVPREKIHKKEKKMEGGVKEEQEVVGSPLLPAAPTWMYLKVAASGICYFSQLIADIVGWTGARWEKNLPNSSQLHNPLISFGSISKQQDGGISNSITSLSPSGMMTGSQVSPYSSLGKATGLFPTVGMPPPSFYDANFSPGTYLVIPLPVNSPPYITPETLLLVLLYVSHFCCTKCRSVAGGFCHCHQPLPDLGSSPETSPSPPSMIHAAASPSPFLIPQPTVLPQPLLKPLATYLSSWELNFVNEHLLHEDGEGSPSVNGGLFGERKKVDFVGKCPKGHELVNVTSNMASLAPAAVQCEKGHTCQWAEKPVYPNSTNYRCNICSVYTSEYNRVSFVDVGGFHCYTCDLKPGYDICPTCANVLQQPPLCTEGHPCHFTKSSSIYKSGKYNCNGGCGQKSLKMTKRGAYHCGHKDHLRGFDYCPTCAVFHVQAQSNWQCHCCQKRFTRHLNMGFTPSPVVEKEKEEKEEEEEKGSHQKVTVYNTSAVDKKNQQPSMTQQHFRCHACSYDQCGKCVESELRAGGQRGGQQQLTTPTSLTNVLVAANYFRMDPLRDLCCAVWASLIERCKNEDTVRRLLKLESVVLKDTSGGAAK